MGQNAIMATPAMSALIRRRSMYGGLIMSASHNPGGPGAWCGVLLLWAAACGVVVLLQASMVWHGHALGCMLVAMAAHCAWGVGEPVRRPASAGCQRQAWLAAGSR